MAGVSQQIEPVVHREGPEATIMTVWPTIGATSAGRLVGRLSGLRLGWGFFTLGKLMALATIPLSLAVFCWQLLPGVCRRYKLTSRRIVLQKGLAPQDAAGIGLDEFDAVEVLLLPGQDWLHCGELIFRRGESEVFRLCGVSRPEIFRQLCLKARTALLSFRKVLREQAGQ
jgi:hypothetical protein